ncbi:MAG: glycosyltransferase [Microscillaceae bacterium]|nr:glycosyltransferase [Microscillaceae bacterium]
MFITISIILLIYGFFNILLIFYWYLIPVFKITDFSQASEPRISVIIPVRNEAANILYLLEDLNLQSLDKKYFEVIVVDDFSEDETFSLLLSFQKTVLYSLKIISLQERNLISPKKKAISEAVQVAQGELIVTTDGDCRVKKEWLEVLWKFYKKKDARLISGAVTFEQEKTLFEKMQTVEFASLIGSGAACLRMGFPNMCNGANLAYPKTAFLEVGGYQGVDRIASGDDEFLLHKIARKYPGQVFFLKHSQNIVSTYAKLNWAEFFNQRKRWSSKWKYYQDKRIKILAFFIFVVNCVLLASLGLAVLGFYSFERFLIHLLIKFLIEFTFLGIILAYLDKKKFILYIPLVQLVYPLYVMFFGLVAQGKSYSWKGRTLK